MTERSDNIPPPVSSPAPEPSGTDATVVIARAAQQPEQAAPAAAPAAPDPSAQPSTPTPTPTPTPASTSTSTSTSAPDNSIAAQRETASPLTASMTRPALAGAQPIPSGRSPLWAIALGALSGLLLFALTAALLMNR